MKALTRPPRLRPGDTVAAVSLSAGLAGDEKILHRYRLGKQRLEQVFGLRVVEMPHTLAGSEYLYAHPEKRAEDLMAAFADPQIKAIISCIGGWESIRLLPHIDFDVIRSNPKIYSGYSDSTITHLMCFKAGLASFYGLSILNDFAEYGAMHPYTEEWVRKMWFTAGAPGVVPASPNFTADRLEWVEENLGKTRRFYPNSGYVAIQGSGKARGRLLGGCLEVLDMARGTALFPAPEDFEGALLFLETSEVQAPVWYVEGELLAMAAMGLLGRVSGILLGKPQGGALQQEYHDAFRKVLSAYGLANLPVLGNASFGHNEPKHPLPYGALAEIDCDTGSFSILESGVL